MQSHNVGEWDHLEEASPSSELLWLLLRPHQPPQQPQMPSHCTCHCRMGLMSGVWLWRVSAIFLISLRLTLGHYKDACKSGQAMKWSHARE